MSTQIRHTASGTLLLGLVLISLLSAAPARPTEDSPDPQVQARARVDATRAPDSVEPTFRQLSTASFLLKDGTFITGQVTSETNNTLTVSHANKGAIVVDTYSREQMDLRTLRRQRISEPDYYEQLGDSFSQRTGDFRQDPDDFIQAIRLYKSAHRLLRQVSPPAGQKAAQLQQKIDNLEADRLEWTKQLETRADLNKLQFEATLDSTISDLTEAIAALDARLDDLETGLAADRQQLTSELRNLTGDLTSRLDRLDDLVDYNRIDVKDLWDEVDDRRRYSPLYVPGATVYRYIPRD